MPASPAGAATVTERPARLVVVAGTATDVGKTWVAAELLRAARDVGWSVAARKPAQSFEPGDETDAEVLGAASGERAEEVCPPHRWYERAIAPFMAADTLGRPRFTVGDLIDEIAWPPAVRLGLMEGLGGVRSPISHDGGDTIDLIEALAPDLVVLVAEAGLGTLNAVRTCLPALEGFRVAVMLNRYDALDDLHPRNAGWLTQWLDVPICTSVADVLPLLA
jgi:dethiobiotin synthetase